MECFSEAPHSGGSPWKGLLITASVLSCWIQASSAQGDHFAIVPTPSYGTVGGNVMLTIQGFPDKALAYSWYRKSLDSSNYITVYSVPSGVQIPANIREKVFSNGSLLIPNLILSDTGLYLVSIVDSASGKILTVQEHLAVYEKPAKAKISANSTNVIENGTLVFTCSTENEGMNIHWFFNNQPLSLSERMNMSEDNHTLTIKSVKREDAGSYQCEVWNPIGAHRSDSLTLTVNYGPDHIVILPSPESGEIEVRFKEPLILVCQVEAYPAAQYEWQVNGTMKTEFSHTTYIIKSVSWEDAGKYVCLAENNVTNLSVSKDVTIKVVGENSNLYENPSWIKGSAPSAQGLGSSSAFHEVPSESPYQVLNTITLDVYDRIETLRNPQAYGREESP
ncbi:carcinoembryonic antigen-related cell adhesion molecule 21-like [Dromiciops gliroides]|uniref:carcinoembryonic antigen-related cell adhesion molecule 21-like n=1 Tax=Dromiciops gliroides TaxID=33562 RepID=UPI001CC597FE|nr:carcinoembryonic antigen-related cell adhesion molecule 21-like [Dromiciops gliroides]